MLIVQAKYSLQSRGRGKYLEDAMDGRKMEDGRWKTENGKRKTENGKRKTENGKRKTENGKRKKICVIYVNTEHTPYIQVTEGSMVNGQWSIINYTLYQPYQPRRCASSSNM